MKACAAGQDEAEHQGRGEEGGDGGGGGKESQQ